MILFGRIKKKKKSLPKQKEGKPLRYKTKRTQVMIGFINLFSSFIIPTPPRFYFPVDIRAGKAGPGCCGLCHGPWNPQRV